MRYWLMKTEPEVFSFEALTEAKGRTTCCEGVRNYQARNFLRDEIKKGHRVLVYHSNIDEPAVYGIAEVVREGYPDPTALDPKSDYYDEKAAKRGENPWVMVDIKAVQALKTPVTRDMLAKSAATRGMMVLQKGARLSVQPVTEAEFRAVCALGGLKG